VFATPTQILLGHRYPSSPDSVFKLQIPVA